MPPRRLQVVNERFHAGYLEESLKELRRVYDPKVPSDRVLMAELLLETEGQEQIRSLVGQYIDLSTVDSSVRARACITLAAAFRRENRFSESVQLHERAVHLASKGGDVSVIFRANLLLLATKFELFGPASLGTLARETWQSAVSTGDSLCIALLHCYFAGFEGRRGAFDIARRHLDLSRHLIEHADNPYVDGLICNNSCTVAAVSGDPISALDYAKRALELTNRSGDRYTRISTINNLCHVSIMLGRIADAQRYLSAAESLVRNEAFLKMCLFESRAHIQLLSGRLDECETTLAALASLSQDDSQTSELSYSALEVAATQTRLLRQLRQFEAALDIARGAAAAARNRRVPLLEVVFNIHCADALLDLQYVDEATAVICQAATAVTALGSDSLTVRAELERTRGRVLALRGNEDAARARFALSVMMHSAAGQTEARDEAIRCKNEALSRFDTNRSGENSPSDEAAQLEATRTLSEAEAAANLFTVASRADLLATLSYDLLLTAQVTVRVAVVACTVGLPPKVVRHDNWITAATDDIGAGVTVVDLGTYQETTYRLLIEPATGILETGRLAAFETIIRAAVDKDRATKERLERTSVLPMSLDDDGEGMLCTSQRMREVYREVRKVAASELTILLTGETGVGKEILAREIHRLSKRATRDFRPVVCVGFARSVLESQLFGHRKGSFTGAVADFPGIIRGAQGGTLFLDEVGELTPDLQIKLLRFLDSKEVHGLGELEPEEVDIRVIAATNANLAQLIEDHKFREDLLYRLGVATFNIPPLRERREEIPGLVEHFLARYAQQNRKPAPKVSDEALEHLLLYRWPGNIRQLRNEMERLAGTLDAGSTVRASDLKPEISGARHVEPTVAGPNEMVIRLNQPLTQATEELEREMIRRSLNGYKGNLDDVARALGITRKGLYHKRRRLGMD